MVIGASLEPPEPGTATPDHLAKVPSVPEVPLVSWCRVADGSEIAAYDLGGDGEPLLLAHATGFHARVLGELARHLGSYHCYALDFRGHGRSRSAAGWHGEWAAFATDVLGVIEWLGLESPYGFGHSCGGAALLLAEERAPGTFAQIYCYEPVVLPLLEPQPPAFDHPLALGAARRREIFASKADALAKYSSKAPLSSIDPRVLRAYVEHGFESDPDGSVRLRCRPSDEAMVYANATGHFGYRDLPKVRCPVELACGALSSDFGEDDLAVLAQRLTSAGGSSRVTVLDALDHFGPMVRPDLVAASIVSSFGSPAQLQSGDGLPAGG
jgi:pimeloyl-ACP methyl ester carboxylesterase